MTRTWQFPTVADAARFVGKVAEVANELNHHPDLVWKGRAVVVTSITHDAGGAVTGKDEALIARLEALAG